MRDATETTFTFTAQDGTSVFVRRWCAEGTEPSDAKAAIQIAHGMGEHSARYARFAAALVAAGYVAYANDHRGHGHTAIDAQHLGDLGTDGWNRLVTDQLELATLIDDETKGRPRAMFAHSMGSFALQQFLFEHGDALTVAVLCGTTLLDGLAASVPVDDSPVELANFNAPFEPARTQSDWLSRDEAEVDKYVNDPMCGFGINGAGMRLMAANAHLAADPSVLAQIRNDLPLLMISGSADPLSGELAFVELLAQRYRDAGLTNVNAIWYTDARHELLNETNRDEVTADVISWFKRELK